MKKWKKKSRTVARVRFKTFTKKNAFRRKFRSIAQAYIAKKLAELIVENTPLYQFLKRLGPKSEVAREQV